MSENSIPEIPKEITKEAPQKSGLSFKSLIFGFFIGAFSFYVWDNYTVWGHRAQIKELKKQIAGNGSLFGHFGNMMNQMGQGKFFDFSDEDFEQQEPQNQEPSGGFQVFGLSGSGINIKSREDEKFVYFDIDIKDLVPESFKVQVQDGMISVSGQTQKKLGSFGQSVQSFSKTFDVPPGVDEKSVEIQNEKEKVILKFNKN